MTRRRSVQPPAPIRCQCGHGVTMHKVARTAPGCAVCSCKVFVAKDPPKQERLTPDDGWTDDDKIQTEFLRFHGEHPEVFAWVVHFAKQLHAAGRKRIGIKMLMERIRFEVHITPTHEKGEYKINNSYSSRYARKLAMEYPELGKLLEFRSLTAK